MRLYGLRNWVEQADKQVKGSLGWSQYQARSDRAMRRHWALGQCAFAFCWWAETHGPAPVRPPAAQRVAADTPAARGEKPASADAPWPRPWRCWPVAPRRVRAWLAPALFLRWCWSAWSEHPPPPVLQALLDWLLAGHPLMLYDSS